MVLGPQPEVNRDDPMVPTPAALDYIIENVRRPSVNTLPPGGAVDPFAEDQLSF